MNNPLSELTAFENFEVASRAILQYLHQKLGFKLWMMTRTEGADWIVLQTENHGYDVTEGTVLQWADSFCSQMVLGRGPQIAPTANDIPVYAKAPIGEQVPIGAYIGAPITRKNGSLFGTLCAIDPEPQNPDICDNQPLIDLMAKLLSTILDMDLKLLQQTRQLDRFQQQVMTDPLTGVLNRRGWEEIIKTEEARAKRYGTPISVLTIDLDSFKEINDCQGHAKGDETLKKVSSCLKQATRETDTIARLGGDEFGIIAIECDKHGAEILLSNIQKQLSAHSIDASIGMAMRHPEKGLSQAIEASDSTMYKQKKLRKRRA